MNYHIASFNVNGLRSSMEKGLCEFLVEQNFDLVCLQETKSQPTEIKDELFILETHFHLHLNAASKKGYSGTAILFNKKTFPESPIVKMKIGEEIYDNEGRFCLVQLDQIVLINAYYPNGRRDHSRVDFKLDFSRKVLALAQELSLKFHVILTGDFNTAHREIDLKNPKSNQKTTGFLPRERAFIDEMIAKDFQDVYRHFYPHKTDAYTWWSYRGECRKKNVGWRLDYFFVSKNLLPQIEEVIHHTDVGGSDHCPLSMRVKTLCPLK